jgi:fibronectin-binding autotransporter adhesin
VVKDGSGTLILSNTTNKYTGTDASALNPAGTQIRGGVLSIGGDGSLGLAPTNATNNIFFTSSAYNTNIDSIAPTLRADANGITLAPTRNINIASGVNARIDTQLNTLTIAGVINGPGGLTKTGFGTLNLANANTYTGPTTITQGVLNASVTGALGGTTGSITVANNGTLLLTGAGNLDRINDVTPIVLAGGTPNAVLARGGSGVVSEGTGASRDGLTLTGISTAGLGALSLMGPGTINFGTDGIGTLVFGTLTSNNNTLTITNWTSVNANFLTQTSGIDGSDDRLIFSGVPNPTDLAFVNFDGRAATFVLLDTGFYEVVPVPEPSTWIGAALALAAIGWTQRRKLRSVLAER